MLRLLPRRGYRVLAVESSCDDSCVALLEKASPRAVPRVVAEVKSTLASAAAGGIIPTAAHHHHNQALAGLVREMGHRHGFAKRPPDLVCVTRGPGMAGSLTAGLQLAKGLSIGWNVPVVGVHHMVGHLLTPQLETRFDYPFLSLLCSGGHTMLVLSAAPGHHRVVANTIDIAVGDCLDKCARELGMYGNMLAKEMEAYIGDYTPSGAPIDFPITLPMRGSRYPRVPDSIGFSFASFLSKIQTTLKGRDISDDQRRYIAYRTQEVVFDHIVDRINVALEKHGVSGDGALANVRHFVCSGGVAANSTLRHKLQNNTRFASPPQFHFPRLELCTDNAAMIGVAGIEMFEQLRLMSDLSMVAVPKWPMDQLAEPGWLPVDDATYHRVTGF
ncbi:tRNA N6-adenosine threonylcarbamoyltransferase, mitochondrial [Diutina catenulata]